jgi:nucleoside phosphorylase/GNAT superfamily N-acetyltransferase
VIRRIFLSEEAEQIFSLQATAAVFRRHYPRHAEWLRMAIGEIVSGRRFGFGIYVPEARAAVAELRLVGSIVLKSELYSRVMQLKNLYIDETPGYRRRRLATQLFSAVERFCIQRGSSAIDTEVPVQEKATVAFLNSVGFLVHAHLESPYRRGDLLYRMYKPLPRMYTRDPFDLAELTQWALERGLGFSIEAAKAEEVDFTKSAGADHEQGSNGIELSGTAYIRDNATEVSAEEVRRTAEVFSKRGRSISLLVGRKFSREALRLATSRRVVCISRRALDVSLAKDYSSPPPTFEREQIGGIVVPIKATYLDGLGTEPRQEKTYFKGGPVGKFLSQGHSLFFFVERNTGGAGAILALATIRDVSVGDPPGVWERNATRSPLFRSRAEYDTWSSDKSDIVAITYSDLQRVQPLLRSELQAIQGLGHVEDDQVGTFYLSLEQTSQLNSRCKPISAPVSAGGPVDSANLRRRLTNGELPDYSSPPPPVIDVHAIGTGATETCLASTDVLLVTTARIELDTVLQRTEPRHGSALVLSGSKGQITYWFGRLGEHRVAVVRCTPGAKGRDAAALTVSQAIRDSDPLAVIAVGIAFGGYTDQLKMCDVLISDQVIPYEMKRSGAREQYRGPVPEAGPVLLSRFANVVGWDHRRPDGRACMVKVGPLLSGETLLDNLDEKVRLFSEHPSAIGGEMEAAGIYAAADRHEAQKEWIVVKSVCDWADGTKKARGDSYQPSAAEAAMSLVKHVLLLPDVLVDLKRP